GQVKRADMILDRNLRQLGAQEVNIIPVVKPITKYAVSVMEPEKIKYHLQKAYYMATTGRKGPVWLDIPLDVQGTTINEDELETFSPIAEEKKSISMETIDKIISLINTSKRPVFFIGNGVFLSDAQEQFLQLAKSLNIPILTTWKTIDLLEEDNLLFIGRPGSIASRGANFNLQNSDLFISIGARMDFPQVAFSHKNFAKNAKKIIVDIDENEINKLDMNIDVKIVCDAKIFINELYENKERILYKDNGWIKYCKNLLNKYPLVLNEYLQLKKYVNSYVLIDVLSKEMSEDDIFVPGSSGSCSEVSCQSFKVKKGQFVLNNQGLGSMGFGLPASIGACIASGKKRTICINGDGGFFLNIQELEVVKRLKLPIKYFILNNDGYGSIRNMQNNHFNGHYVGSGRSSGVTLPDIQEISKSYGIEAVRIETQEKLSDNIRKILDFKGPYICEVMIDPKQIIQPRVSSKKLEDGSMMSMPIENMYPFLPEEELKENIINNG
ncbi:MAG: thiamine pyrophosphate-binding protein, partial [Elusimicrobia bacterium]|nr:thiamine pyrophosphate-binding protein [Elusimicrobiota bacterium]